MEAPPGVACMDTRHPRRLLTSGQAQIPHPLIMTKPRLVNPSCPLQALNGEGQQEADNLQLETSGPHRVDLLEEKATQPAKDRFYVLANRACSGTPPTPPAASWSSSCASALRCRPNS